tara:strand:- start:1153 stop:1272 length:120 start_codon:yes stop_codon:yes gene_type:complete
MVSSFDFLMRGLAIVLSVTLKIKSLFTSAEGMKLSPLLG